MGENPSPLGEAFKIDDPLAPPPFIQCYAGSNAGRFGQAPSGFDGQ